MKKAGERYQPPPNIDMTKPSIARVYSYLLGGKDHFEVDREMANYAENAVPGVTDLALGNRAFVQRAVRHLAETTGLRQFLDIGSGLPSDGNVHEIAHQAAPDCRVVYVDNDPMVLAHARALLADDRTTVVVTADLNQPADILTQAERSGIIDFGRPVGLILGGILHHLHDHEDPGRLTRELCGALAPGSHVAISHFHRPDPAAHPRDAEHARRLQKAFLDKLSTGLWRSTEEIRAYFGDWELLPPGLVPLNEWHPLPRGDDRPGAYLMPNRNRRIIVGGVARRP
ncbi:SAM-dependent methyltransferase [Nocardiopsis trehalosi]|jgi:SAM-dependent methyltransferase|uniref:SAM-dependent methyltransferase n=1 Tax=Nocardiopsis trehalosi TaxID=109329 RepID=UPI0034E2EB64